VTDHPLATADGHAMPVRRGHALAPSTGGRPWTFYVLATVFVLYVIALYGPMICIYILSVSGRARRPRIPDARNIAALVYRPLHPGSDRRCQGRFQRSIRLAVVVTVITRRDFLHVGAGIPQALRRRQRGVLPDDREPGRAGPRARYRRRTDLQRARIETSWYTTALARSCRGRCRSACW